MGNFFNQDVALSSKKDDWRTPKDLFDSLNNEFNFTVDLCASDENALCDNYFTKDRSCFDANLKGQTIFCNPPYGRGMIKFIRKCYELSHDNIVVILVPSRTDTGWFHDYILPHAEIRFIKGRLRFTGAGNPAPFPSMIAIFRSDYGEK